MNAPRASATGFSLLEVLVALAIVALALTAVVRAAGLGADAVGVERERTFATWVAANVLTETLLVEPFPQPGERNGRQRMGPSDFTWTLVIQTTDDPDIRRLDVRVFASEDRSRVVTTLSGFAGQR